MLWLKRLMNTVRPQQVRSEIDEELQHHIESRVADNIAAGMNPQAARMDALRRFGGTGRTMEAAHEADIYVSLDTIIQDIRYGIRKLISNPTVTVVALVSLAFSIGASTAIFSVVDAVLMRALPYREPDRIVLLWQTTTLNNAIVNPSIPNFESWKARTHEFEDLAM
jgi:hypothetical protein